LESVVTDSAEAASAQGALIAALAEVGIAASAIPDSKAVRVEALTDEAQTALEGLGFKVREMPDGSFEIIAATDEAEANLGRVARDLLGLDGTTATPAVDVDDKAANVKIAGALIALQNLGKMQTKPRLDADEAPVKSKVNATLQDLFNLGKQKPTPVLDADDGLATKKVNGALAALTNLGRQRPTPVLEANDGPVRSKVVNAMGALANLGRQSPTPQLNAKDNASGIIQSIIGQINSVPASRTSTITVINRVINEIVNLVPKSTFAATGGAIEAGMVIQKFDGGGAVSGRGGPLDDLITALGPMGRPDIRLSNGEHVFDAHDVGLLGGQAGVYAFRELLNSGKLGKPPVADNIRRMVETGSGGRAAAPAGIREVTINTSDNPRAIIRALRADEQQQAALAAIW
jgi:hypothetical protein